ncbi:MAG: hypothetical protein HOY71_30240 [Nonomuraea sp.]|nr:hypothetical protein [Nonomuraea sp.]
MKIRYSLLAGVLAATALSGALLSASATATTTADANSRSVCQAYVAMGKAERTFRGMEGDVATPYYRGRTRFAALQTVASDGTPMAKLVAQGYQIDGRALKDFAKNDYSKLNSYRTQLVALDRKIRAYC